MKLQRQIGLFGAHADDMPPIWVNEGTDGVLAIVNGVTRATRMAKLAPGRLVPVEIIAKIRRPFGHLPKVGDFVP
jgi:hypothetical protein